MLPAGMHNYITAKQSLLERTKIAYPSL